MCKFKNINYEWDIRKGDTPSVNTGPDYDVSGKGTVEFSLLFETFFDVYQLSINCIF